MESLALNLDGIAFTDRETDTSYILHNDCHDAFMVLMATADVDLNRFVEIGPVKVETCNYGNCTH